MTWLLPAALLLLLASAKRRRAAAPSELPGGGERSRAPDWSRWREACAARGGVIKQGPASDLGYQSDAYTVQYCELPNGKRFGVDVEDVAALEREPMP